MAAANGQQRRRSSLHEKVPRLTRFLFGDGSFCLTQASNAAIMAVLIIYFRDNHWTAIDLPSMVGFILLIMASRLATDVSERGEKICYLIFLTIVCVAAYFWNLILDHDCTECLLGVPEILKKYLLPTHDDDKARAPIVHLFAEKGKTPQKCASCFLSLASYFKWVKLIPESVKDSVAVETFDKFDDLAFLSDHVDQDAPSKYCTVEGSCPAVQDPKNLSPTEFRTLDEWYETMREATTPRNSLKDLLMALAEDIDSEEGKKLLNTVAHDILCYPISRMNGPKPSEFLKNLEDPRWTGEENFPGEGPMDIEFEKLLAIMRGDMMHSLPADVCAMIRIASGLAADETVLTHSMSAARVAPIANEISLKGEEHVSYLFPGIYIPKVDEDKDPEGTNPIGLLISVFKRLPIDDTVNNAFETREEYLAFFRWLLEHKIQDEFYFPAWLSGINGTEEIGDLVSNQFRHRGDRQRIFDVTSDETLATRAFFGAGMKTLTNIVLPGDPSYGYLVDPSYYNTEAEREFFKNEAMPTEADLLNMAEVAWGSPVKKIKKLRGKVVQVDYTLASHWEYRPSFEQNGAILYLDAEKRIPMGIWVCAWQRIVLPTSSLWEQAKFVYRGTEVVTAALMHVGEYHLGWAERFSNAIKQTLPHSHGLRALMKPYTHGTGQVNYQAYQMLLMEDSILARADGFTNHGRSHSWGHWVKHTNLKATLPDMLAAKKLPAKLEKELVYFKQGKALWDMHYAYVDKFVDLVYGKKKSAILEDDDLKRFWHHINSGGRRLCPCVCSMDSTMFFTTDKWPAFESRRTCEGLLNHTGFETEQTNIIARREAWCKETLPQERIKALYKWLESDCERAKESDCEKTASCKEVWYKVEHMRHDMGLPELSRKSLVNLITRFIYEVTIGHEMAADNIPFIVDPYYGGVRRNKEYVYDKNNKQPMVDVSTWVFGTVISTLTTIRSMPLLADWSDLLESWVDNESDWRKLSDADRAERKKAVKDLHFEYKKALILNANEFLKESLQRPQNQWSPFLNPAVQAGSIAV